MLTTRELREGKEVQDSIANLLSDQSINSDFMVISESPTSREKIEGEVFYSIEQARERYEGYATFYNAGEPYGVDGFVPRPIMAWSVEDSREVTETVLPFINDEFERDEFSSQGQYKKWLKIKNDPMVKKLIDLAKSGFANNSNREFVMVLHYPLTQDYGVKLFKKEESILERLEENYIDTMPGWLDDEGRIVTIVDLKTDKDIYYKFFPYMEAVDKQNQKLFSAN